MYLYPHPSRAGYLAPVGLSRRPADVSLLKQGFYNLSTWFSQGSWPLGTEKSCRTWISSLGLRLGYTSRPEVAGRSSPNQTARIISVAAAEDLGSHSVGL